MTTKSFELSQMANTITVDDVDFDVTYGHTGIFTGDLTVEGDFTVNGETVTVTASELAVSDNLIYLNNAVTATITDASGDGSAQTYTATNNYQVGWTVTITGMNPSGYNVTNGTVTAATATTFSIGGSTSSAFVSGGTASAKSNSNPDLGFAGGYNNGTYAHAGLFRDTTDNKFKFFDSYTPEPDASAYINTAHASFNLAPISAAAADFESLVVDTTTLVVDATNNRVGIGVASPDYRLHIRHNIAGDGGANGGILIEAVNATAGEAVVAYKTSDTGTDKWFTGLNQDADFAISYGASFGDSFCKVGITSGGNVGIGTTNPSAKLDVRGSFVYGNTAGSILLDQNTVTTTSVTQTVIETTGTSGWSSSKVVVSIKDNVTSETQLSELLLTHNGSTAVATEYGVVYTSGILASFDVDISGGNMRLLATSASTNSTTYNVAATQLK